MTSATRYTHVALTRELSADLDTPVGAYLKLAAAPYSFLLESMVGGERWGRYSFIGLPSREVLRVSGEAITLTRDGRVVEKASATNPMEWIRAYAARRQVKPDAALPRFSGGLVGYFGYDCVRYFEPRLAATQPPDTIGTPDILLMLADELVAFDNQRAILTIITHALADDARRCRPTQKSSTSLPASVKPNSSKPCSACRTTSPPATACKWCRRSDCRHRSQPSRSRCTARSAA
jgi:anthranilate synthase component 1